MGIVEELLAEFTLSEIDSCRVEYNARNTVHLHLDKLRIEMTPEEFEHFVDVIERGQNRLEEIKKLEDAK